MALLIAMITLIDSSLMQNTNTHLQANLHQSAAYNTHMDLSFQSRHHTASYIFVLSIFQPVKLHDKFCLFTNDNMENQIFV